MAKTNTTSGLGNIYTFFSLPDIIICTLGAVSNALLLVAFINDPLKCFRNSATYLVMNLSVSDCLTSLLCLLFNIIPKFSSYTISLFFIFWIPGTSFASIASISIDRFLMVSSPIKHRILMKGKIIILCIASIWIISCIAASTTVSDVSKTNTRSEFYIFSMIVIILSSVMYSSTCYKLKKQSRNIALQNSSETRAQEMRIIKEERFLKTIIIIACIAFLSAVPFLVLYLLHSYVVGFLADNLKSLRILYTVCVSIFYVNFAINPLIYILRLPNYRKTFYLLYCRRKTTSN